ncbi:MAG: class I SAM-dependent rRNA methyltransferase, partial [Deltaproteobacteria bacterium]|nr:class I SAM-dependent rRNA methyltransferase [Deltaproteobacteria bacterium]
MKAQILKAFEKRENLSKQTLAYRIFDGVADGKEGLYIDRFGDLVIAHWLGSKHFKQELVTTIDWKQLGIESVYFRAHQKDPKQTVEHGAQLILGEKREQITILEHGISYLIRPERAVSGGLFLDTRDIRGQIKKTSEYKKVLNTFCYTGSLGIAAASGAAREVVQVDSNKSVLSWARENYEINQLSTEMRFIPEDSFTFMQREAKRIEKGAEPYDLVILDPPTFGRSKKGAYRLEEKLEELVLLAFQILSEKAELIFTANYSEMTPELLEQIITINANRVGIEFASIERLLPPE